MCKILGIILTVMKQILKLSQKYGLGGTRVLLTLPWDFFGLNFMMV
jgi:hypothetical protein